MSYATILIPGSGIIATYENIEGGIEQLSAALGIFLITWMIVTFFFLWVTELNRFCIGFVSYLRMFSVVSLRKTIPFVALFSFLTVTFAVLAAGEWTGSTAYVSLKPVGWNVEN